MKILHTISICVIFVIMTMGLIGLPSSLSSSIIKSSYAQNSSTSNTNANATTTVEQLNTKMAQISSSNKPEDVATFAYIWGFPLVTMERQFNFVTSSNVPPGIGRGPANTLSSNSCARDLVNASFTDVVRPNADTLYCVVQFDLKNEAVVIVIPPISSDRYSSFEFLDAYTNVFAYVGTRATGSNNGGTYLLVGPDWNGQVPQGMTKIWSPTNLVWLINRILVKEPADVANVHAIQDKIVVKPLSAFQGKAAAAVPTTTAATTNASSKQIPIGPQPTLIAPTGIKIYDEIGKAMIGNPLNPPDPGLVTKIASVGIGPGKSPSTEANDTIKKALQTGITEGQKMIDAKIANLGTNVNGWSYSSQTGVYGTDYLFRAAIAQGGLGANIAQEALYPTAFTDIEGKPFNGTNNYVIHFNPGQIPPVNAFWSVTMYNDKQLFVDNPINRYNIGKYTQGLKNNTDGSLDIYVQHATPGKDKESNWLPSPEGVFSLNFRFYLPAEQILNGTWTPPPVKRIGG